MRGRLLASPVPAAKDRNLNIGSAVHDSRLVEDKSRARPQSSLTFAKGAPGEIHIFSGKVVSAGWKGGSDSFAKMVAGTRNG